MFRVSGRVARLALRNSYRTFASADSSVRPARIRYAKPFFTSLLVVGIGLTAYGIYDYMTMWPIEVRGDLKAALKEKYRKNYDQSAAYFRRAWQTAKEMPIENFSDRYVMTTGIATALAEVLELQDQPDQAYDVYSDALNILRNAHKQLTYPERHRAVQLAYKLGTMAKQCGKATDEEERYLVYAVEEVLKLLLEVQHDPKLRNRSSEPFSLGQVTLPSWISKTDVGAPLEALAAFYKEAGKFDYAMPLYLHLVSLMIPPGSTPVPDQCRGAEFMGHLAETILLRSTSPESLHQAEAWAQSGLSILQEAQKSPRKEPICDAALVAAFINVATLQEMKGVHDNAKRLYQNALQQSSNMQDSDTEAMQDIIKTSLRRLEEKSEKEQIEERA